MNDDKNLLLILGEWWQQRQHRKSQATFPSPSVTGWRWLLPTSGNVIFTLLVIGSLLWAQRVGAISLGAPLAATTSTAGIPYQGRLADKNGAPLTQTVNMIFRLYAAAGGGSPLWEEQWTGANSVQVSDGLFNVMLGSLTPIPQNIINLSSELKESREQGQLVLWEVQSWLFGLEGIGQQTADEIDQEIGGTAVTGMGNLRDIFELVVNGFDNRAFARHHFIEEWQEAGFGGLLLFLGHGNELNALVKEAFKERLGDVALIAKEFAP